MQQQNETDVSAAWTEAGRVLDIDVEAPFTFRLDQRVHSCLAYLPHFGGNRGLLVMGTRPPDFETDATFVADAEASGYAWTFINIGEYHKFNAKLFVETATDWGFTGPDGKRPSWL